MANLQNITSLIGGPNGKETRDFTDSKGNTVNRPVYRHWAFLASLFSISGTLRQLTATLQAKGDRFHNGALLAGLGGTELSGADRLGPGSQVREISYIIGRIHFQLFGNFTPTMESIGLARATFLAPATYGQATVQADSLMEAAGFTKQAKAGGKVSKVAPKVRKATPKV